MTFRPKGFVYISLVSSLIASAILLRYIDPFFVRGLRLIAFDSYQRLDPGKYDPNLPIRIVDIDEESLSKIGQWPWPRNTVAELLLELAAKGAAVVAFDVLFAEPDRTSFEQIVKRLPANQGTLISEAITGQPTNDQLFADALKETPSVLTVALGDGASTAFQAKAGFAVAGDDPRPFLTGFKGSSSNLPELDKAARGIGAFNWTADRDQIVRRVALMFRLNEALVPSLAAETLRVAQGASTYVLKAANASGETAFGESTGLNHIRIGDIEVPTDEHGLLYMKFRHFDKAAYIPAWKVLAGQVPQDDIDGRMILVGTSAPGLLDLRATPLDAAVPGIDIQAQVLEHLLTGRFLTRPDYALALEEFVILAFGIMLAVLLPRVSAMAAVAVGLLSIGLVLMGGWVVFRYASLLLDPSYPAVALGLMTAGITSYVYQGVEAQRSQIRNAFGRYLAPSVVQEMIAHPERLQLGGEVRELTLMFCDVRNFTTISQHLTAVELTTFINELLSPLSEIILEHRGTIDKYMGDAIMAFWNAPVDDPEHRTHACRAALDMAAKMDDLNEMWRHRAVAAKAPHQRVNIGIGLNTGQCCVGNLGSTYRFDYSAIGDDVNITSRFEGLTKIYGVPVIVSKGALAPDFPALELDTVLVKGRTLSTQLYTFLESLGASQSQLERLQPKHGEFLAAYRQQHWDAAESLITECRNIGVAQLDTCYSLFASRISSFRQFSLPPDWDGAFVMMEK
jgi:adenylate cyclase